MPFIYVRSSAKAHGLGNMIEGYLELGKDVIVIEDLISTGNSSLNAVAALREAGANVKGMVAIFSYGFQIATDNFKLANCELHTLTDYHMVLKQALKSDFITDAQLSKLENWRKDPEMWSHQFQELA